MADSVQKIMEDMVPELEDLQQKKILDKVRRKEERQGDRGQGVASTAALWREMGRFSVPSPPHLSPFLLSPCLPLLLPLP
jgi:hypothetical protein